MANENYLLNRVRQITKSVNGTHSSDNEVIEFLKAGARLTIGSIPYQLLWMFATDGSAITDGSGQSLSFADTILSVRRNGVFCDHVPLQFAYGLADSGSLLFATAQFPKYYIQGNTVYIKPDPSASKKGYVNSVGMPTIGSTSTTALGVLDEAVISFAARFDFFNIAAYFRDLANTELDNIFGTGSATSSTSFTSQTSVTVTHNQGAYPIVKILDSNGVEMDAYVKHTSVNAFTVTFAVAASGTILISTGLLANFENAIPEWVDIANPSLPSFDTSLQFDPPSMTALPSMTAFPTLTMPTAPTLPTLSLDSLATLPSAVIEKDIDFTGITAPSYSAPSVPTIGTLAVTIAPAFSDLDLSGITVPSNTLAYVDAGAVPTYIGPSAFTFSTTDIDDALLKAKQLIDDGGNVGGDALGATKSVQGRLATDDTELARETAQTATQEINRANSAIQNELAQLREFEAEVKEKLGQFSGEVSAFAADVQNNSKDLDEQVQQYINDLKKYQLQVDATVREWLAEQVQFKLAQWLKQVDSDINEFRAQNDGDLAKYNAQIQEAANAYKIAVSEYVADVQKLIGQYTAESDSDTKKYIANYQKLLSSYQTTNTANINEYQVKATALIAEYRAEIEDNIQEYRSLVESYIQQYTVKVQAYVSEFSAKMQASLGEYNAKVQAEIQKHGTLVSEEVQRNQMAIAKAEEYLKAITLRMTKADKYINEFTAHVESALIQDKLARQTIEVFIKNNPKMIELGLMAQASSNGKVAQS